MQQVGEGMQCPKCNQNAVVIDEAAQEAEQEPYINLVCNNCGGTWRDNVVLQTFNPGAD